MRALRPVKTSLLLFFLLITFTFSFYVAQPVKADTIDLTVNTNKERYYLRENVSIYGTLKSDGTPVADAMVAIEVDNPLVRALTFRTVTIGTPPTPNVGFKNVSLADEYGNPEDTFYIPIPVYVPENLKLYVNGTIEILTTLPGGATMTFTICDNNSHCIGSSFFGIAPLLEGITKIGPVAIPVEAWATTGTATIYANIYTQRPLQGGYPLCPEKVATFTIIRGSGGSGSAGSGGGSYTGTDGTYECGFRLSPEPTVGTHTVICNALVGQEQKQESKTFEVKTASYPPQASFTYTPPEPWVNVTVVFDASASTPENGTIISYEWDFGDGTDPVIEYDPVTTHIFTTNDTFTVTLNVTDSEGLWCITSKPVTVSPPYGPTADFTYSPPEPFVNGTTTFNASYSTLGWNGTAHPPIVEYRWDFDDGTDPVIEYDPITAHIYEAEGNYTVTLNVTDTMGWRDTASQNLTVHIESLRHDIAIMSITYVPPVAYRNATPPIDIGVVVRNNGTIPETFNMTAYYNVTATEWESIETQNVIQLYPLNETTVHFTWNTSTLPLYVNYVIKVETSTIPEDTNPADNTIIGNTLMVKFPGDANGDQWVDWKDLLLELVPAYGTTIGDPGWNPSCDFNGDGWVDWKDLLMYLVPFYGTQA